MNQKEAAAEAVNTDGPKTPKSFVIRASEMTKSANQLVHDLRRVMEPHTASRLRVKQQKIISSSIVIFIRFLFLGAKIEQVEGLHECGWSTWDHPFSLTHSN